MATRRKKKPVHGQNHLLAWREFRKLTQDQLAEAVGTNASVISLLENGERGLSDKWLTRLAPALRTSRGYLLDFNPNDIPTDLIDLWLQIPADVRPQALTILETFKKKA